MNFRMLSISHSRWVITVGIVGIAAILAVSALLWQLSDQRTSPSVVLWPEGSAADIATLRERDDLNVLFILVDTLRASRLSAYGYERETSPALERLASRGIRFDRHLAQSSWTKASMASLWTAFNPPRTGITAYDDVLPDDIEMPAERLSAEGFRTVGLYRNGWVSPKFGFQQGFDVYTRPSSQPQSREYSIANPTVASRGTDEDVVRSALEFMRVESDSRWFLYLHLMDLHEYIYDEASARFGSSYSDIYDSSVLWTDTTLDLLLGEMLDRGLLRKTIIVIASDHGEAFRERGYEGHARFVYPESTEVPLIMLLPFRLANEGIVIRSRTRNVDIWPTIYDLIGVDPPPALDDADGLSLVPEILAAGRKEPMSEEARNRTGLAHLYQGWGGPEEKRRLTYALAGRETRYVKSLDRAGADVEELFDMRIDPLEQKSVHQKDPDLLAKMRSEANALSTSDPYWGAPAARELNELELNQLRALGYELSK